MCRPSGCSCLSQFLWSVFGYFFFPRYFDVKAAVSLLLPSTFLSSRDVLVLFGTLLCVVFRVLMFLEHEKLSALFFLALVPNSIFRE